MYQIALCDDETAELNKTENIIKSYRERHTDCNFAIERFTDAEELLGKIREKQYLPDIVFMDIYMPEKTGMEAAREIRRLQKECRIIFLTTSKEHALEAFRVDASQYLVKPISENEMFLLLEKVLKDLDRAQNKYLLLRIDNKDCRIALQDIVFCEAQKKRQCIYLADGTQLLPGMTMTKLYEMLSPYKVFAKVGISYIVNMEHIVSLSAHELQMDNKRTIYPPRGAYQPLRERYFSYYCEEDED